MFRRRQKIDRWWLDPNKRKLHDIRQIHDINESQHKLKLETEAEYIRFRKLCEQSIEQMEANLSIFDEQMGHPMEKLDEMMEIFK